MRRVQRVEGGARLWVELHVHGVDRLVELLEGARSDRDRVYAWTFCEPGHRQRGQREPQAVGNVAVVFDATQLFLGVVATLVHRIAVEARATGQCAPAVVAGEQPASERVVDAGVKPVLGREGEVLEVQLAHE